MVRFPNECSFAIVLQQTHTPTCKGLWKSSSLPEGKNLGPPETVRNKAAVQAVPVFHGLLKGKMLQENPTIWLFNIAMENPHFE